MSVVTHVHDLLNCAPNCPSLIVLTDLIIARITIGEILNGYDASVDIYQVPANYRSQKLMKCVHCTLFCAFVK